MRSRAGFTLIELMVAMALTMFIMVILSQAFVLALETFAAMKGLGDMQRDLRTVETMIRDDLSQDRFEGKRRLSDLNNAGTAQIAVQLPQAGFLAVARRSLPVSTSTAPYVFEGYDANGIPSYRATDHLLYMTVKRKGNRQESFFTAALHSPGAPSVLSAFFAPNTAYNVGSGDLSTSTMGLPYIPNATTGTYSSQWAEVLYYLVRTGTTEQPNNPTSTIGTPTYALYRAQFVMVPDGTNVNTLFTAANGYLAADQLTLSQSTFAGMSCNPDATAGALTFYSPADAALGKRVIPDLTTFAVTDARVFAGATLVLPNVISFQVQVMPLGLTSFDDTPVPTLPFLYDTTKFGANGYGLKGIQITLRVWDTKTRQTRQSTIVQDL